MSFRNDTDTLINIGGMDGQVYANRIVMISDSQVMVSKTDADPDVHDHHVRSYELFDESAKDFAERVMEVAPDVSFVRTAKRGGSYINPMYIEDVYTNGVTLDVYRKDIPRDVPTTYTGTEMSQQIEAAVLGSKDGVPKSGRRLPDISGIETVNMNGNELSME